MKIITKKPEKIVFAEEMSESLANAIRRSSLEIPILAVDEVEFHKNDSVLYDEILALRIGLVPLKTPKGLVLPEKCACKGKGCAKCTITLKLSVKGPGTVYSKDMKGKAEAVYPEIPLTELIEGQEVEFVASARLGKGIEHTKYSPALVYYSPSTVVEKIDKKDVGRKTVVQVDEKEFGDIKANKSEKINDFAGQVVKYGEELLFVKQGKDVIFIIESWGQISAQEVLEGAVKALNENLKFVK